MKNLLLFVFLFSTFFLAHSQVRNLQSNAIQLRKFDKESNKNQTGVHYKVCPNGKVQLIQKGAGGEYNFSEPIKNQKASFTTKLDSFYHVAVDSNTGATLKYIYLYNAQNYLSEYIVYVEMFGVFEEYSKDIFTYNQIGLPTKIESYYWDTLNTWRIGNIEYNYYKANGKIDKKIFTSNYHYLATLDSVKKCIYYYNNTGDLSHFYTDYYDTISMIWKPVLKDEYVYNGSKVVTYMQNWWLDQSNIWQITQRDTLIYDTINRIIKTIEFADSTNNIPLESHSFSYYSSGFLSSDTFSIWEYSFNDLIPEYRQDFLYDNNGNQIGHSIWTTDSWIYPQQNWYSYGSDSLTYDLNSIAVQVLHPIVNPEFSLYFRNNFPLTKTFYYIDGSDTTIESNCKFYYSAISPTGINQTNGSQIGYDIFPNPFSNSLQLKLSFDEKLCEIQLINALGELVLNTKSTSNEISLNTSSLPSGLYFLRIIPSNGKEIVQKCLKY